MPYFLCRRSSRVAEKIWLGVVKIGPGIPGLYLIMRQKSPTRRNKGYARLKVSVTKTRDGSGHVKLGTDDGPMEQGEKASDRRITGMWTQCRHPPRQRDCGKAGNPTCPGRPVYKVTQGLPREGSIDLERKTGLIVFTRESRVESRALRASFFFLYPVSSGSSIVATL